MSESPFKSEGLVRDLSDLLLYSSSGERKPLDPDWCESLAAALVGTMIGRDRYLLNDYGRLYGNIFVIFVGAAALSFKSVPLINIVRPVIRKVTERKNENAARVAEMTVAEVEERISEMKKMRKRTKAYHEERKKLDSILRRMVDYEAPQKFTSEFLYTWLKTHPQGIIVGDEYTKMFRGAKTKDYLADNMEDLSRLYDCDAEKVGTQTRGVEYPSDAYICFCSATTYYLLTLMRDDFFIQGTGTRILWILDDVREKIDVEEETMRASFWWGVDEEKKHTQKIDEIVDTLIRIDDLPKGLVQMDFDAGVMLDRYRAEKYNQAVELFNENRLNMDANLVGRLAQNAMKLALIHCVGRYVMDEATYNSLEVNKEDAQWAIDKMEKHYNHYKDMMTLAPQLRKTITKSYRTDQQLILYWIDELEKRGKRPLKTSLMRQTGFMKDDMQDLLDAMLATKQIQQKQGRMYAGKTTTYYERTKE